MGEISILYDNHAKEGLRPGFGFSAYLRTEAAVVLFDSGADKMVLEGNADAMGCDLDVVTAFVISHDHCDHMGAISSVLHKGLRVYAPAATRRRFARINQRDMELVAVKGPTEIVPGVRSIGQFGRRRIPEQALLLDGADGPVLITGCAHPGVVKLARRATELVNRPLSLVLGGFHLMNRKEHEIRGVIEDLRRLGIERLAPCHCTGEKAVGAMREAFGDGFIEVAAGSRIAI
ncbi:MAG: MBL fold metallo-hydrolase [Candidatus Bipolaricaulota bacterium]|nr:MAG: MBL fold metallo-hydrolase [Candidatus Bipolaricaulota bacterium]